ncbi:hypothetical protein niasHT_018740 [Heterodera trifolii]|uniref:Integrase catalytic domain-containing protein n=1 Tax=Heterodera trifolii TaxID=157864 RepID=A0ABD2LBJ2_9BILA
MLMIPEAEYLALRSAMNSGDYLQNEKASLDAKISQNLQDPGISEDLKAKRHDWLYKERRTVKGMLENRPQKVVIENHGPGPNVAPYLGLNTQSKAQKTDEPRKIIIPRKRLKEQTPYSESDNDTLEELTPEPQITPTLKTPVPMKPSIIHPTLLNDLFRKRFPRLKTIPSGFHTDWQCDLCIFDQLKKHNDGYKYLLVCIDVLSRMIFSAPAKSKKSEDMIEAFDRVFEKSKIIPMKIYSDSGLEFQAGKMKKYFEEKFIIKNVMYSPDLHAGVVERANRTIKERLYRYFTKNNTLRWVDNNVEREKPRLKKQKIQKLMSQRGPQNALGEM